MFRDLRCCRGTGRRLDRGRRSGQSSERDPERAGGPGRRLRLVITNNPARPHSTLSRPLWAAQYEVPHSAPAFISGRLGYQGALPLGAFLTGNGADSAFGFVPSTSSMTAHGLPAEKYWSLQQAPAIPGIPDGVSRTGTAQPATPLITLATPGRDPADITIRTQAGTQGSGGPPPTTGSHESPSQSWAGWLWSAVTYVPKKLDQAGGAALSFVLTGSANTGEYGSFVGIIGQYELGGLQAPRTAPMAWATQASG